MTDVSESFLHAFHTRKYFYADWYFSIWIPVFTLHWEKRDVFNMGPKRHVNPYYRKEVNHGRTVR